MKTTLLTLASLLLSLQLSAQHLKGIVRQKSGTPVPNAQVIIKDVTFSKTVGDGRFELKLPADHVAGTRIVLDVQADGMELVDEREIVTYVRRDPDDLVLVRMAPQGEKQRETARIKENLRQSIERSYKKKFEGQQQQHRQQQGLLADENSRLARERDQALQLVDELAKEMYRADLSGVDSTYRLAYNLFIEGKVEEAQAVVKKANLRKQLSDIQEEKRQRAIRDEEIKKAEKQIAQTSALDAKMKISDLKFKEAEEAYELAVEADTVDFEIIFEFAVFLNQQNNYLKAAFFYEKSLQLSKDEYGRSGVLNNLGSVYRVNQKMPEAEKAYNEALGIRRQLADKNPDVFLPDVAATLDNLGNYYSANQKMTEADTAYNEALSIRRKLADKNPDAFLPDLATTLNNLGVFYHANQKMTEADTAYNEALSIQRQLVTKDDAFLPALANTLNNLGAFYRANQKMAEAEEAYTEALSIRRKLADKNPDAFLPDVAVTLDNLGNFYKNNQRMVESEKAYIEALSIQRQLAAKNPDAFLPALANTLNNLGTFYYANQRMAEAEKAYNEALSIRRKLAIKNSDAFLPDVAATLNNLAIFYCDNQKMAEAEKAYNEALSIYRQLAAKSPDAFLPYLATTLNNLGNCVSSNQRNTKAKKALNEALSIYRQLAIQNPNTFLSDVSMSLENLGFLYATLEKYSKALSYYQEALHIRQQSILLGQSHFYSNWGHILNNVIKTKNSAQSRKDYRNVIWASRLLSETYDNLQNRYLKVKNWAVQEYGSLSWWALFARDYPLAERAALRCLALDPEQIWVYTNLGHANLLRGDIAKAKEAYLPLKGKKDGNGKDYKLVLEEDFQALEAEGITHKGMRELRKWLREKW